MSLSLLLVSFLTFVEFNCENLFDCHHDSLKQDYEFLPEGPRKWNQRKFWNKLNNISKTIISCGMKGNDWFMPDFIALCEVENDSCMQYLCKRSALRKAQYEYIITQSPDVRGIDVALMYAPGRFLPISHYSLNIQPVKDMRPTRDILYVSGRIMTDDTLHIFVVHAPSKYGGSKQTLPYRKAVTHRLAMAIDSIKGKHKEPNIIVAGDFNDYANSPALRPLYDTGMVNVSEKATGTHGTPASYKYKGEWKSIDHIFFSSWLLPELLSCHINDAPFLLEKDEKYGGVQPFRTYRAYHYRNAYSDHLPIVVRFTMPQP